MKLCFKGLKSKTFDACVHLVMIYGTETLTHKAAIRLRLTKQLIEMYTLKLTIKDRVKKAEIIIQTGITDTIQKKKERLKWNWTERTERTTDAIYLKL